MKNESCNTNAFYHIEAKRLANDLYSVKNELDKVSKQIQIKPIKKIDISLCALVQKYNTKQTNKEPSVSDTLPNIKNEKAVLQRKKKLLIEEIKENKLKIESSPMETQIEHMKHLSYEYAHER